MLVIYVASAVIGAGVAIALTTYSYWEHQRMLNRNFIKNGDFEKGDAEWGTGYLEDAVRNGNYPDEEPLLPYVVSPNPKQTTSHGEPSSDATHGVGSYLFHHTTDRKDHHWGSLAQRVTGLEPGQWYVITFSAKAEGLAHDGFFLTTDLKWRHKQDRSIESDVGWKQYRLEFNTLRADYADVRFVITAPGKVWIDDVVMRILLRTQDNKEATTQR